jgi:putative endonuclease
MRGGLGRLLRAGAAWRRRSEPGPAGLGRRGERLAARVLRRRGCRILGRNVRVGRDEVDLLAVDRRARVLVVVEVKTRSSERSDPAEGVNRTKRRRLERAAAHLAADPRWSDHEVRFDVVIVSWRPGARPQVEHVESAFEAEGDSHHFPS